MRNFITILIVLPLIACDPPRTSNRDADACHSGLVDCNGKCSALGVDNSNCGACGVACSSGQQCVAGRCATLPSHDRPDATVAPVPQVGCTPRDANEREVCSKSCGTFTRDLGCGVVHTYDCPRACTLVETCDETKHVCCVDISRRLDSFCRFFPYYSSSPAGAGATPARESNTRIPSPEEVGFLYCSYPGFVNCAKYWDGGTFVPAR